MKTFKQLIDEARSLPSYSEDKITRSAFIYLDPRGKNFAQCGSCYQFLPGKKRCAIFSNNDEVVANASCGLYIKGTPHDDQEIINSVTPEQAGYVLGQVRCENCSWFKPEQSTCDLFAQLNKTNKDIFDLDTEVSAEGCCNAWQK